jgi:Pyruvate/2-oxoacid:ferredoxin oxidoreductase delta subunit
MPAIQEEIDGAEKEGVDIRLLAAPIEIQTENGHAKAMRCQVMELGEPDDSGRRRPVPIEGEEFTIEVDTVIAAISQEPDFTGLDDLREGNDWIKTDESGATKEEGVYSGGDNVQLALVTTAIYQGRVAAETIDYGLSGIEPEKSEEKPVIKTDKMVLSFYEKKMREHGEEISPEEALADPDREIQSGLTEEQVVAEAARCLSCGQCFDCGTCWSYCQDNAIVKPLVPGEPYKFKLEFCKGCDKCAEQCPCGYIEMYDPMTSSA